MSESNGWTKTLGGMPKAGDTATRDKIMSMQDIELFTQITGDRNPLHYDEALAKASMFGGLIVQGGVTTGILNALVAEDLPGPGTVFLAMEMKFSKAVYVGDTITGSVEIKTVRADKPICTIQVEIVNQKGEVCVSGTASTYTTPLKQS